MDLRSAIWLVPFLGGIVLMTWFGGHGGGQTLTETQACLAVIGISLGCYYFARQLAISPEQTREYFEQIEAARIEDSRID
jgi:hypothetical protein